MRLARVSGECHDLLSAASVIGRDVDLDVLASTVRWEPSRCLKALDEAVAEQLLYETSDTGRYRFSHTLFVEALYESASAGLRAEVHRRAGEAIERLRAGQIDRYVAELASHYARAALTDEDGKRAVDWTARAGRRDMELLAYEDAVDHYEQALALCDRFDCVSASRQCELLLALADAANRAGNLQQCNDAAARAAELAAQLGERELQSRATLLTGPRTPYGQDGTWLPEDIARLEAAIAAWGNEDSELHALLLARLGMSLSTRNYVADATAKARQALQMGERVTQAGVPQLLHYAHGALFVDGAIEERLAIARSLIAAARSLGDTEMEAHGHVWLYADLLASGEIADADRVNQELMRLAESMRQPFFAWYAFAQRSASATLHGRFDESERCAAQAAAAAKGSLPPGVAEITEQGVSRFALRLLRGDLEGLAEWYTPVADAFEAASGSLTVRCFPTLALAEVGRLDEAKQHVCRLMESAYLSRNDYMWLIGLGSLIETCALLDERRWAADMYEALLPYSSQCIILAEGGAWRGAVTHFLGVLSTMMGEWDDAERHFAHAIAVHERAEAPPFIARTQYEWAKMLVARNDGRGRARALKLLSCAGETARDLGMQPLARRVGDLAGTL
jgi:tetratricopeptide (TPR) repeat protein